MVALIFLSSSSIFKKLRMPSIFKNIEVVFHISSSWVRIRQHTKNQLPRLPRTAQIVMIPGVVWCGGVVYLTDNNFRALKLFWLEKFRALKLSFRVLRFLGEKILQSGEF